MLQTLTYRTRKCWGTTVKFTICSRGHTAQSVAYLGHQRHNCEAKRLSKKVESGSRKGKGSTYVGTNLCFTSSLHSSMVEPLRRPTP